MTSDASTKLCTTVSICQCKQMSFQLPFESTRISKFLESKRTIIPSFRSGIREASFAELALQKWKFISESVERSESSSAGQIGSCFYHVRQVGRSTADMHQMHKYAQFERYAKLNWEPVKTPKRRRDVLSCSGASDESGGCILDPLQWMDCRLRKCCQNGVVVIHSGCHKSRYQPDPQRVPKLTLNKIYYYIPKMA